MTTTPVSRLAVRRTSSLAVTPAVAGHRGASGHRPEHTLEAYRHAIALGADEIELDLVSTADGVLVARHESELSVTTDVADRPELAHRRSTRVVDGRPVEGWFVEDLTLDEVRLVRARERWPALRAGSAAYDGVLGVPTFDEVLTMLAEESARHGRSVGVLVELKDPAHSASLGLDLAEPLLDDLRRHRRDHSRSRVSVMSFEPTVLRSLAGGFTKYRIDEELQRYLRDVEDHLTQVTEQIDGFRQLLRDIMTVNATLVAQKQNEEMKALTEASLDQNEEVKRISAWAAILFAPTLIGTVYGMNFDQMPELHWRLGYPFALLLMGCVSVGLWAVFRRRRWI